MNNLRHFLLAVIASISSLALFVSCDSTQMYTTEIVNLNTLTDTSVINYLQKTLVFKPVIFDCVSGTVAQEREIEFGLQISEKMLEVLDTLPGLDTTSVGVKITGSGLSLQEMTIYFKDLTETTTTE